MMVMCLPKPMKGICKIGKNMGTMGEERTMKDVLDLDLQLFLRGLLPEEDSILQELQQLCRCPSYFCG